MLDKMLRWVARCSVLIASIGVASQVQAGSTVLSDSTFADADWLAFEVTDETPNDSFAITANQQASGGNPDAYWRLTHSSSTPVGVPVGIASGHVYLGGSFDPAAAGAIMAVDFSWDGISIGSSAGAVGYAPLVRQGGSVFVAGGAAANNGSGWVAFTFPSLAAADFSNPDDPGMQPDFSEAGGALDFGFLASNGTFGDSFNEGGVDNWMVVIHPVPEPVSAHLYAVGSAVFGGLLLHRSVRSRSHTTLPPVRSRAAQ